MRSVLLLTAVTIGLGSASVALADEATPAQAQVLNNSETSTAQASETAIQPVRNERVTVQRSRSNAPLKGEMAWFVAGAAGALVPLALFALPAIWLGAFGPFAPIAFLVAIAVATITTGLGGALAWAIQALFSDMKSGFLVPILGSAAVGLGTTFAAGALATAFIAGGVGLAWIMGGMRNIADTINPANFRNVLSGTQGPILGASVALGALTWGAGVLAASVLGPMVASYLYRANGEPKYVEESVTVESQQPNTMRRDDANGSDTYTYPRETQPLPQ